MIMGTQVATPSATITHPTKTRKSQHCEGETHNKKVNK
jgi:hypothetical protein